MRPFRIVKDRGLQWLCRTGRPNFYLPDETTVAKDVKFLYNWTEGQLAEELEASISIAYLALTNIVLIGLPWPTCIPARLLDIPQSSCVHEYLSDVDTAWRTGDNFA